jgi:uncharacterized membrane protein
MMIEIIPNWHPVFVHFTIGLLSISALLYLAGSVLRNMTLLTVARWNLWIGASITAATVLAGFYAYNTVIHDAPSHIAMTNHRNWALLTSCLFIVLALWAFFKQRGARTVHPLFVATMLLGAGLLAVTGYKGGEVVFRHGLGVQSTPDMRNHALIVHSHEIELPKEQPSGSHTEGHNDHNHGNHAH